MLSLVSGITSRANYMSVTKAFTHPSILEGTTTLINRIILWIYVDGRLSEDSGHRICGFKD